MNREQRDDFTTQLVSALVSAAIAQGVPLAVDLVEAIVKGVVALIGRLTEAGLEEGDAHWVGEIVDRIEREHAADWSAELRSAWVRDSLAAYFARRPGIDAAMRNSLIELALQRVRAT